MRAPALREIQKQMVNCIRVNIKKKNHSHFRRCPFRKFARKANPGLYRHTGYLIAAGTAYSNGSDTLYPKPLPWHRPLILPGPGIASGALKTSFVRAKRPRPKTSGPRS